MSDSPVGLAHSRHHVVLACFGFGELARGGWGNLMGRVTGGIGGGATAWCLPYKLNSKNPISKAQLGNNIIEGHIKTW